MLIGGSSHPGIFIQVTETVAGDQIRFFHYLGTGVNKISPIIIWQRFCVLHCEHHKIEWLPDRPCAWGYICSVCTIQMTLCCVMHRRVGLKSTRLTPRRIYRRQCRGVTWHLSFLVVHFGEPFKPFKITVSTLIDNVNLIKVPNKIYLSPAPDPRCC